MKGTPADQERAGPSATYVLEIAANSLASALAAQEGALRASNYARRWS